MKTVPKVGLDNFLSSKNHFKVFFKGNEVEFWTEEGVEYEYEEMKNIFMTDTEDFKEIIEKINGISGLSYTEFNSVDYHYSEIIKMIDLRKYFQTEIKILSWYKRNEPSLYHNTESDTLKIVIREDYFYFSNRVDTRFYFSYDENRGYFSEPPYRNEPRDLVLIDYNNPYEEFKEFYNLIKSYFLDDFSRFIEKCLKNFQYVLIKGEGIEINKITENRIFEYAGKGEKVFPLKKYEYVIPSKEFSYSRVHSTITYINEDGEDELSNYIQEELEKLSERIAKREYKK